MRRTDAVVGLLERLIEDGCQEAEAEAVREVFEEVVRKVDGGGDGEAVVLAQSDEGDVSHPRRRLPLKTAVCRQYRGASKLNVDGGGQTDRPLATDQRWIADVSGVFAHLRDPARGRRDAAHIQ
ncbi:hypothetical protein G9272_42840 [Streptomyces asoensis]|uniref:Uncharacterized protein n=1 Tax=Streptomyces asoensis TaxID=249586 RepID=A0A6M4WM58_9ACTN|nr:hypothetical protein [Streptomyces asoensis]QJS98925.1 hypothetical protein G9272_42840 [Streptomyces asoensis]